MDDFACPRCRTTKFQNPSLKMLVNVCGHGLCESCVELLFLKGGFPEDYTAQIIGGQIKNDERLGTPCQPNSRQTQTHPFFSHAFPKKWSKNAFVQETPLRKSVSKEIKNKVSIRVVFDIVLITKGSRSASSGSCPDCKIPLRRNNFRVQLFEDASVEKEVEIRRRVLRDFNKKEEDFGTLKEYNDYLEEVETIIYNLSNDIDVINTNKKIEQYKKDNRELIQKNKGRLGREEYELEELLEFEKHISEARKQEMLMEENEAKKKRLKRKEALIDELMFSNTDAKNIIDTFAQQAKEEKEEEIMRPPPSKVTKFSSGIEFGRKSQSMFLPVPTDDGPTYQYTSITIEPDGPQPPSDEDIAAGGFMNHIRMENEQERAGGFKTNIACLRALQESMMGLYHVRKPIPSN